MSRRKKRKVSPTKLYEYRGHTYSVRELAKKARVSMCAMRKRLNRGWTTERAVHGRAVPPNPRYDKTRRWQAKQRAAGNCVQCGLPKEVERAKVGLCLMCKDKAMSLARDRSRGVRELVAVP